MTAPTAPVASESEKTVQLPGGYYLFQHRPSDMTCSLHMPDGLHIGNLWAKYAGDFAALASQSKRIAQLEGALEPFAKIAGDLLKPEDSDDSRTFVGTTVGDLRRARAALSTTPIGGGESFVASASVRAEPWQDIATAPKDGAKVDLWCYWPEHKEHRRTADAAWSAEANEWTWGGWRASQYKFPPVITHWMPRPAPPQVWEDGPASLADATPKDTTTPSQGEADTSGVRWLHKKSGHVVAELGRGFAQVSAHPIEEMSAVVIYEHGGNFWVRNAVEFDDGRFEPFPPATGASHDE